MLMNILHHIQAILAMAVHLMDQHDGTAACIDLVVNILRRNSPPCCRCGNQPGIVTKMGKPILVASILPKNACTFSQSPERATYNSFPLAS